ncbi:MAG: (d)CMP kinase [Promethearchaeota archaeon]
MIISISGAHGTGKSTVAKILASKLGLKYYSTGEAFRELAEEKGMSLEEFTKYVEKHPEIDKELDEKVIQVAKEGNVVIESQLAGHLLKDVADLRIHLKCPLEIRVKRMAERDGTSKEEKLKETLIRENSELKRFMELYNINLNDENAILKIHDLIIDTQNMSIEEVVNTILSKIKK